MHHWLVGGGDLLASENVPARAAVDPDPLEVIATSSRGEGSDVRPHGRNLRGRQVRVRRQVFLTLAETLEAVGLPDQAPKQSSFQPSMRAKYPCSRHQCLQYFWS